MSTHILVVDDDLSFLNLIKGKLIEWGYEVSTASNPIKSLNLLKKQKIDLLLLDLEIPPNGIETGFNILQEALKIDPSTPVVIISAFSEIKNVMRATKLGIHDFIEKPLDTNKLSLAIKSALERGRLRRLSDALLKQVQEKYQMVGISKEMQEIFQIIEKVAPTDCRILITGETGVGKELVARAIHLKSKRAREPFINRSCAAIPEELAESLLFGHKKGAFTGAHKDQRGWFSLANGGTLFLDEIGDLSLRIQAKILKVLDEGKFEEVGGEKPIKSDVRIIAATNKNLEEAVKRGDFRQDLFFRLNEVSIYIPPLRDRKEDIPVLVNFFMEKKCREYGISPKKILPSAMELLISYRWPGNVRELEWTITRLILLVDEDIVTPTSIASVLNIERHRLHQRRKTLREMRDEWEREYIKQVLMANNWNIKKAAEQLGIERTNLYRKMKSLGIKREKLL
jgi:two-component system nitrogen regulation response regulator NtrX